MKALYLISGENFEKNFKKKSGALPDRQQTATLLQSGACQLRLRLPNARGWESSKSIQDVVMKKLFPLSSVLSVLFRLSSFIGLAASIFLWGCMATQNRWQATQMRQQVMDYYNDQIMENLIRTQENLPFVHVDVTSLTTTDAAALSGTVGNGETTSFTRTSPSSNAPAVGALHTIARGVTRPFSYSISPSRNTSLQILASPVLGALPSQGSTTTTTKTETEVTTGPKPPEGKPPDGSQQTSVKRTTSKEVTVNQAKPKTICGLYSSFIRNHSDALQHLPGPPKSGYVPGTIKRWGTPWNSDYYFIVDNCANREAYRKLCQDLFTKGPGGSVQGAVQGAANAAVQAAGFR